VTGTVWGPGIGMQQVRTARLRGEVRIGSLRFQEPLVGLVAMPADYPQEWNIGGQALRELVVTLDQANRRVRLTRPAGITVPPPAALRSLGFRSGVRDGARTVQAVDAGSAAERLGVRPGDVVETVNDRPAAEVDAGAWSALIQQDRPIRLRLNGSAGVRTVTLTPGVVVP
jgi:hypothetical protein